ncbi:MAG: hypothetical protein ACREAF_00565 [Nitrosopumilaceae archaeon]
MPIEISETSVALVTIIVTVFGTLFGIYQYNKDQINRRKDTLMPLTSEFDDDANEMRIAKDLLDNYKFPKGYWDNPLVEYDWYEISNLEIFRHHEKKTIDDAGEQKIRESFDALLDFFGKVGYLLDVGLIKKKEIEYFRYYLDKTIDSEGVGLYVSNYEFPLYLNLLDKLNYKQKGYVKKEKR